MSLTATAPLEFTLPLELEAREPLEMHGLSRDAARLLVTQRSSGETSDARFIDLPSLLRPGDLVVVNDSATLPAALDALGEDGRAIALHCSTQVTGTLWIVEPRGDVLDGEVLRLPGGASATLIAPAYAGQERLWFARVDTSEPIVEYLHAHGRPIRYRYVTQTYGLAAYQTIFARVPGSAEMPSAGRPFTSRTLEALRERRVETAALTLHAGVSSQERDEPPLAERFAVPQSTARAVNAARRDGRRVIAVGTTVVRALESAWREGEVVVSQGWTDLIVTPERGIEAVDGLLTGLHEPRSSHLQMLRAFLSESALAQAYRRALEAGYRWHEFGDVHLIA